MGELSFNLGCSWRFFGGTLLAKGPPKPPGVLLWGSAPREGVTAKLGVGVNPIILLIYVFP